MTKLVVENDNELFNNLPYDSQSNILQNPDISRIHQGHSQVVNHFKDNPSLLKVIERKKFRSEEYIIKFGSVLPIKIPLQTSHCK